ncbi:DHH phosphoesterase [Irpex rosettiformis]|uniref:DHH phosphoesterase n=1 Tax=Irpex rosettiformis TaxID=378272 RepID=A0ACB8U5K4_9APHY|nr:DHH phosphoesterase [Irpex rosettiformis]
MSDLAKFLSQQRENYLEAVKNGKGKDWTVVMGNEAGDLDSLASATAFAWYRSAIENLPSVPLSQTLRGDLHLRAENLHAMQLAGLDPSNPPILCIDDIPSASPFPSNTFALVDHNRLLPQFSRDNPDTKVVAIVDHHEDEGYHKETAEPRIVKSPIGSASSLVARFLQSHCADRLPPELAIFLLSAILVDTAGLQPGGKAGEDDRAIVPYLLSRANFASGSLTGDSELHFIPELQDLTSTLLAKKGEVSHFNTRDLLRRDYKEYSLVPSIQPEKTILVGLATVPVGLKTWIHRVGEEDFWTSTQKYIQDRDLTALGILTSFRDSDHPTKKHHEGKHRREQLFLVREGVVEGLADKLFDGLKHAKTLDLKKRNLSEDYGTKKSWVREGLTVRVWEQGNAHATRKVTAPLVKNIIEGTTEG